MEPPAESPSVLNKSQALSFFFGGLLPIIAFTVIEDQYGPLWGTIAGMGFGCAEIIFEKIKYQQVSRMTWAGNIMILFLGGISILTQDGFWFKIQPALFELGFALMLWGSSLFKKPLLLIMAEKQNPQMPEFMKPFLSTLTFRLGFFFLAHAILATWAALSWSTRDWALLKGVGLTVSFIIYLIIEFLIFRKNLRIQK